MIGRREETIVAVSDRRHVYADERSCINCIHNSVCFSAPAYSISKPLMFEARAGWGPMEFSIHIQSIYGGLCSKFVNKHPHIHEKLQQRLLKEGKLEYDL